jgi:nucleoside-diphosphate-sugar epimerase
LNEQAIAQKLAEGEKLLESWANLHAIEWIVLRPTLIYGYGRDKNITAIAQFIQRYGFFPVLGNANGLRQPIHGDDVSTACFSALWAGHTSNRAYDITGGETLSYRQMVERVFAALKRTPRIITIPFWIFRVATSLINLFPRYKHWNMMMATRMNQNLVFESLEAKRDLNFSARPFRLETKDLPSQNQ